MKRRDSIPSPIAFDWDEGNIDKNKLKHGVDFRECEEVFFNRPLKIFPDKKHSGNERRLAALGITDLERKLAIVFTLRKNKIRIISARDQSRKERRIYEEKK